MIKANKGEWSEFYAFVKILSEGKLFAADAFLERIPEKSFDVLNIAREEERGDKIVYDLILDKNAVSILEKDVIVEVVEKSKLREGVKKVFDEIKNASAASFTSPESEKIMSVLHCKKIKSPNTKKQDLDITIQDRIASLNVELGFSVKSMLGGSSTLLNASSHTNFVYCVEDKEIDTPKINEIAGSSKVKDRVSAIGFNYGNLSFTGLVSEKFENNLKMIDSHFPEMMGEIVLAYYQGKAKTMDGIIDQLETDMILAEKLHINKVVLKHKIKEFLVAIALGMTPGHSWTGETGAHGGYIIVKEDGDVVCYHLYNRDEFKEYLYNNIFLDTPSSTRHKFGTVYDQNGKKCIKLNLQIRFKK